jgi:hypothetical protein
MAAQSREPTRFNKNDWIGRGGQYQILVRSKRALFASHSATLRVDRPDPSLRKIGLLGMTGDIDPLPDRRGA